MKLIEFYKILYSMKTELPYQLDMHVKYTRYEGYHLNENGYITFNKGGQVAFTNDDIQQTIVELFQNQYSIQVSYLTLYDEQYKNNYLINIQYSEDSTLVFLLKTKYNRCCSISLILNIEEKILLWN